MPHARICILFSVLFLGGCSGTWHEQSYMDQRAYIYNETTTFQGDLTGTIDFLKSIGLKRITSTVANTTMTEIVLIRDLGDHFHENVTVRGLARLDSPGWVITIRVESYNIGEEGAIDAGQALMNEIDHWRQAGNPSRWFTRCRRHSLEAIQASDGASSLRVVSMPASDL